MSHLAEAATVIAMMDAQNLWLFGAVTVVFAALGRAVRGVTSGGALAGAAMCFALLLGAGRGGFAALLTVFLLTWASTRFGYSRKTRLGTAESRAGRNALQVLANLGVAGACALLYAFRLPNDEWLIAMCAALAEASADTTSSEIGQAIGGAPVLITNWRRVAPGTNGALTAVGTAAGIVASAVVALVCWMMGIVEQRGAIVCAGAGGAGMLADSVLGATLERRDLLGNNGVNFVSTGIAAALAFLLAFH